MKKFIYCFSNELKEKLIQSGYKIITHADSFYIFENSSVKSFNFNGIDKEKYMFTNKMVFK